MDSNPGWQVFSDLSLMLWQLSYWRIGVNDCLINPFLTEFNWVKTFVVIFFFVFIMFLFSPLRFTILQRGHTWYTFHGAGWRKIICAILWYLIKHIYICNDISSAYLCAKAPKSVRYSSLPSELPAWLPNYFRFCSNTLHPKGYDIDRG